MRAARCYSFCATQLDYLQHTFDVQFAYARACSSARGHMQYATTSMYTWFREQNISVSFGVFFVVVYYSHLYHFTLF